MLRRLHELCEWRQLRLPRVCARLRRHRQRYGSEEAAVYGSVLELGAVVAMVEDGSGMGPYTVQADVMPAGSNNYALGGVTYRGGVESFSQACASRRLADDYSQMPSWLWHGRHKKLAR